MATPAASLINSDIKQTVAQMKQLLYCDVNFDIVYRPLLIGEKECCLFFIDGFLKDDILEKIMEFFLALKPEQLKNAHDFAHNLVPYGEVALLNAFDEITINILSGVSVLFVDGFSAAIAIDARTYPQRETSEPDKDKVFRGSKDGFVETLVLNAALIRRRIRDPKLCIESHQLGKSSKTDLAICYMRDRCDPKLLAMIREKITASKIEALTMNQETLAEVLLKHKWYNPFPKFKYTERPDTTAAQIIEGDIIILVDNSPSAMILPTTLFDVMEEANDYYFPPITGTYLRLTRFLVTLMTLLLTPLWLYFINNPQLLPPALAFILPDDIPVVPIAVQLFILEFTIDGLKLASLNTPNMLTTSLSMIGAIVVSDFAVQSGWFSAETMLYMAFVTIANYSQPGYELGYALKFMRLLLLALTALLPQWGFYLGLLLILCIVLTNKTIAGTSYIYPLLPFNYKDFKKKVLRIKVDD